MLVEVELHIAIIPIQEMVLIQYFLPLLLLVVEVVEYLKRQDLMA